MRSRQIVFIGLSLLIVVLAGCGGDVNEEFRLAIDQGDSAQVQALINEGADVTLPSNETRIALTVAAEKGHTETVEILLDGGVQINSADSDGKTALIWDYAVHR